MLCQRTDDYRKWVKTYARNHKIPIEWAEKGLRKRTMSCSRCVRWRSGAYGQDYADFCSRRRDQYRFILSET